MVYSDGLIITNDDYYSASVVLEFVVSVPTGADASNFIVKLAGVAITFSLSGSDYVGTSTSFSVDGAGGTETKMISIEFTAPPVLGSYSFDIYGDIV